MAPASLSSPMLVVWLLSPGVRASLLIRRGARSISVANLFTVGWGLPLFVGAYGEAAAAQHP